jgi:hypothetical protein
VAVAKEDMDHDTNCNTGPLEPQTDEPLEDCMGRVGMPGQPQYAVIPAQSYRCKDWGLVDAAARAPPGEQMDTVR